MKGVIQVDAFMNRFVVKDYDDDEVRPYDFVDKRLPWR
jgi:hypothetical protein